MPTDRARQPEPEEERVLPRNFDAEQEVLGTLLRDDAPKAAIILRTLIPEAFHWKDHEHIFRAMVACDRRQEPVNLITVGNELRSQAKLVQVGGGAYLTALTMCAVGVGTVRHANIIREKYILREMIRASGRCAEACWADPTDVMAPYGDLQEDLRRILEQATSAQDRLRTIQDAGDDIEMMVAIAAAGRRTLSQARLGIPGLDEKIGPLEDHRVVVLGAKRGVGKTHASVNACVETAKALQRAANPGRVVIFSFESRGMYARRMLSHISGINSEVIRMGFDGRADPALRDRLNAAKEYLKTLPVSIREGVSNEDLIEGEVRDHAKRHPIALVVLDYWQAILARRNRSKVEEFENLAYRFRDLMDSLACPLIVLSQLTFNRDTGRLQTKGSTAPEEVATLVAWLSRDAKDPKKHYLSCEKTREGEEWGSVPVHLDKRTSRIGLVARVEEPRGQEVFNHDNG